MATVEVFQYDGCRGYCPYCGEPVIFVDWLTFITNDRPMHYCSSTKIDVTRSGLTEQKPENEGWMVKKIDGERRYGVWSGNPKGQPEDKTRCIVEVYSHHGFGAFYQCQRKRGHGKGGLYCKQHAKIHLKANG